VSRLSRERRIGLLLRCAVEKEKKKKDIEGGGLLEKRRGHDAIRVFTGFACVAGERKGKSGRCLFLHRRREERKETVPLSLQSGSWGGKRELSLTIGVFYSEFSACFVKQRKKKGKEREIHYIRKRK